MSKSVKLFSALILSLGVYSTAQTQAQAQQPSPEQQQLYMEMVQTSQQIQQLQQQAFAQDAELAEQRDEFIAMVDAKMLNIDPAAEELMDRRDELADELQSAGPGGQGDAVQSARAELQVTMQELAPMQQEAMQDPEVQQMQNNIAQAAMVTMQEIDPDIGNLIARFNEIRNELVQLQQ